jgi:hypothetical protein
MMQGNYEATMEANESRRRLAAEVEKSAGLFFLP